MCLLMDCGCGSIPAQQTYLGLSLSTKKTRKREFLEQLQQVVPWRDLVALIAPCAPEGRKGRPPFPVELLLRIHFMQQWFTLSDPAMEEELHDMPLFRDFSGLSWNIATPDESTILCFRHLLETHKLAEQILQTVTDLLMSKKLLLRTGTIVDATLISAPSSTKNSTKSRDPEMHQTKKGNQWYFGMKAILVWMQILVCSTSCVELPPKSATLPKPTAFCTDRKPMVTAMQAIKGWANVPTCLWRHLNASCGGHCDEAWQAQKPGPAAADARLARAT